MRRTSSTLTILVALLGAGCAGGGTASAPGTSSGTAASSATARTGDAGDGSSASAAWHSSESLTPHPLGETGASMGYYEYLPPGYGDGAPRPLLVALHGGGGAGDGTVSELASVLEGAMEPIRSDAWPADRPFVVLAPQHPGGPDGPPAEYREAYGACDGTAFPASCWLATQHELGHPPDGSPCHTPTEISDFLAYAVAAYDVDPQRVYLTGISCGAFAAYEYLAAYRAEQVAALVAIAGNARPAWDAVGCELGAVAIWAFHGMPDDLIRPADEIEPVTSLMACPEPPRQDVELTTYADADHDAWTRTYDLSAGNDVYAWLLGHVKP